MLFGKNTGSFLLANSWITSGVFVVKTKETYVFHAWLLRGPRIFCYTYIKQILRKESCAMTPRELQATLLRAAQISKVLTNTMDEYQQDLFEMYCNIYESIVKHECEKKR